MKLIILAAGYATRLYPLTQNQPKPLLPVAGKPMMEHVLDNIATVEAIDHAYVVTNAKFVKHFEDWNGVVQAHSDERLRANTTSEARDLCS